MKVQEVVMTAAMELGIADDVRSYLDAGNEVGKKQAELLLECFNLVENELALDYLPLCAEDTVDSASGKISYLMMRYAPVRVIKVTDEWGNSTAFSIFPDYLSTQPGRVKISYTYTPEKKTMTDKSDFEMQVSVRLMAYGVAAEYALATGLFEEAAIWDKKYKEAIKATYTTQPCRRIESRRWV